MQSADNLVVHDTADRVLDEVSSSSISIGSDDNMNVPNPLKVVERFEENNNVPNPLKTEKNNHVGDIGSYNNGRKAKKAVTSMSKTKKSAGRWTSGEHNQFMHGLKLYGKEWTKVANCIPTRTSAQIRSHAQKYFAKMSKDQQETVESTEQQTNLSSRAKQQKTVESTEQQAESSKEDTTDIETKVVSTLASLRDRYQHLEDSLQQVKTPNPLVQTSSPATAALQQEQTTLRQAALVRYEMKRFTGQKKQSGKQTEKNSHCAFVSLTSFPSQNGGFNSSDVLALSHMGNSLKRGPPLTNTSVSIIKDEESFKQSLKLVRDHLEQPTKLRRIDNNL